ncbi:hypothetical protein ML462_15935 [Gramella lutea]|uniref:RiboL-PSP-HEPN domain-containing protein n=1 Tax=Christiangramia lutea TaxID=1607951 RepID=A0A9X1V6P0_9FLAO|nr:hypothetical protein [Christiangramia lutea]MCH4824661.1 hypothetical protein [Christiangramia lutea]
MKEENTFDPNRIKKLREQKLAEDLGITYQELNQINYKLKTNYLEDLTIEHIVSFDEDSPKEILNKIEGLNSSNKVSLSPFYDYDDDFLIQRDEYFAILSNKNYLRSFHTEIYNIRNLNEVILSDDKLEKVLRRQLFVGSIGILEAFLSEVFINTTNDSKEYFRNFVSSYPEFKNRKFTLDQIFNEYERIEVVAKKEMIEVIYHNLAKVKNMYESTFKINFPSIVNLTKAVSVRHDLVHRNGKNKNGQIIEINKKVIEDLLNEISDFANEIIIDLKLKKQ